MSSTAAVVQSVAYHLPKRVDGSFKSSTSTNGITLYSGLSESENNSCDPVNKPSTLNSQGDSDASTASDRHVSSCLDAALRSSLKPRTLTNSNGYTLSTEFPEFSERCLSFQESSAPPLDTVIRQRIQTFPKCLILTDSEPSRPTCASRFDTVLCNRDELETLCRVGNQYVPRQPLGLGNSGNTCYLNSVLQCFLATGPLVAFISTRHQNLSACTTTTGQFASVTTGVSKNRFCGLCGILRLLKEHNSSSQAPNGMNFGYSAGRHIIPSYFVGNVRAICPNLRPYQQEDAHEFLLGLLSRMEDNTMAGFGKVSRAVAETNVIRRIFGGVVRSEVTCHSCRKVSARDEQCFNLSMDITNGRSLQQCLFNYIRHEELCGQNAYKCENCRQLRAAVRRSTIFQGAPILIIQFNRFSRNHKLDHRVEFPSSFNLRPFMTDNKGPPVLYRLYATVNHEGHSCRSGHYVAFTRRNGTWYSHNDSFVNSTNPEHVLRQAPYLLFYEAVNPTPAHRPQQAQGEMYSPTTTVKPDTIPVTIPVDQIPLPTSNPPDLSSTTVTVHRPNAVPTTSAKNLVQPISSTPRIVFNPNLMRIRNAAPQLSPNGSSASQVPTNGSSSKSAPQPMLPSPNKPSVRQLLYGSNESTELWTERPTPVSHLSSTNYSSPSSVKHDDSSTTMFHSCFSGKRKHSPDISSERESSSLQRAESILTDTHYFSANAASSRSLSSNSSPTNLGKRARTSAGSSDSDSSIVWIPITHKDFSRKADNHTVNSSEHLRKRKSQKSDKGHNGSNEWRHKDGRRHHGHHRHRRRKYRDYQDTGAHRVRGHNRFHKRNWHHPNFHRM
ncbi:Ubiquitin carboxyl-terminal hydrolase 36 [Clonorchis sinensis]|uniref:Ubiquitin carboxyl-terminal hydrolase n=1 Tax=Clonorchis sinensis TaxID=79923 RepID=A0A3R7C7D9_CLOSI|nr:Ubiquitin carboxyl-terminal hydrolase 36 [Clonorchis sinensis]